MNDECGIIEWVPDTSAFRRIVLDLYRSRDIIIQVIFFFFHSFNFNLTHLFFFPKKQKDVVELLKKKPKAEAFVDLVLPK